MQTFNATRYLVVQISTRFVALFFYINIYRTIDIVVLMKMTISFLHICTIARPNFNVTLLNFDELMYCNSLRLNTKEFQGNTLPVNVLMCIFKQMPTFDVLFKIYGEKKHIKFPYLSDLI